MGSLARANVKVIMHNTLAASDYGLIDEKTLTPRPNYWAALLWHRTMGTTVLDAGSAPEGIHLYAQCMKDAPGGVTLLALNLDRSNARSITLSQKSMRYTLTATDMLSHEVQLNGSALTLTSSGDTPATRSVDSAAGETALPAASITFFTFAKAGNLSCKA